MVLTRLPPNSARRPPALCSQLRTILDDFSRYYQDVMLTGKGSIYRILNDDQKRKFTKMLEEAQR